MIRACNAAIPAASTVMVVVLVTLLLGRPDGAQVIK